MTDGQLSLHDIGLNKSANDIELEWLADNPDAYHALVWLTWQDFVVHGRRASIGYYAELLRRPEAWSSELREIMGQRKVERPAGHVYVINNSIRSLLARRIMREVPRLAGAFELRHSKHDPPQAVNARPRGGDVREVAHA